MRVKITSISDLLKSKLTNKGLSQKEAQIIANEYLEGELQGKLVLVSYNMRSPYALVIADPDLVANLQNQYEALWERLS